MLKRFNTAVSQSENKNLTTYVSLNEEERKEESIHFIGRLVGKSYWEIKKAAQNYQQAKGALHNQKFSNWVVNDPKYSSFSS